MPHVLVQATEDLLAERRARYRRTTAAPSAVSLADPLLAKPDRAGSLPAKAENGAGPSRRGVVRGCPLKAPTTLRRRVPLTTDPVEGPFAACQQRNARRGRA
jgi:hypothetical protein